MLLLDGMTSSSRALLYNSHIPGQGYRAEHHPEIGRGWQARRILKYNFSRLPEIKMSYKEVQT